MSKIKLTVRIMNIVQKHKTRFTGNIIRRPWGLYKVLAVGENVLVKEIEVLPGEKLSLQSHRHRKEYWTIISGTAQAQRGGETFILGRNQSLVIPVNVKHRLSNPGSEPLKIMEVQFGEQLSEEDIVRYEDDYGRC